MGLLETAPGRGGRRGCRAPLWAWVWAVYLMHRGACRRSAGTNCIRDVLTLKRASARTAGGHRRCRRVCSVLYRAKSLRPDCAPPAPVSLAPQHAQTGLKSA